MNYQLKTDEILEKNRQKTPTLLLHSCCAPCSSYVLEYLTNHFQITILFYNPNISSFEEYEKRLKELKRLVKEMPHTNKIEIVEGRYEPQEFFDIARGLEHLNEGEERCFKCYRLRMEESAKYAKEKGFDYFTTTLSISPHKNANKLNEKKYMVLTTYMLILKREMATSEVSNYLKNMIYIVKTFVVVYILNAIIEKNDLLFFERRNYEN